MNIAVVGYPRSGNTWVSRTLGDILDCPVGGAHNAKPLCTEGRGRKGPHYVMQMHFKPQYQKEVGQPSWEISVPQYRGDPKILLVVRDPRDVIVSAKHYWNIPWMNDAIDAVVQGTHPVGVHGNWAKWYEDWLECPIPYALVRYEDIHAYGDAEWYRVMDDLRKLSQTFGENLDYDPARITGAVEQQEFMNKRRTIEDDGDKRPYGKTIQLKHLYKGQVGRWRKEMDEGQWQIIRDNFGETARKLGYDL